MARTKKSAPGKRKAEAARPEKKSKKQRKELQEAQPQQEKPQPQQSAPAEKKKKAKPHAAEEALLARLLGGMSVATFLATHFEKKPLHVRNNGSHQLFDKKLFSRKRLLKNVLGSHELGFGRDLTVCRYVDGERENYDGSEGSGIAASGLVGSLFDRGYSCQFYQPQRYVDGLCALNSAFETVFGGLAGASAYLTPPNSQALAPHHDDVEVFILQTEGRKKWKLYHPLVELPGEHSSDLSPDDIGEPSMELTLEEGDVLYFPRGVVHQACTDEKEFSTHVTISVYQHNSWANFLEVAMPRVIRDAFDMDIDFRRGLPVGYLNYVGTQFPTDSDQVKSFEKSVKRLVHKLVTHVTTRTLQEAADEAAMDVVANRLPPLPTKDVVSTADVLDDNALIRFKHRSHIRLCLGTNEEDQEPYVAVYYSTQNCRLHHMGLCTCNKDGSDDEEDESEDGEANAEGSADEQSDKDEAESGDNSENDDDDEDGVDMDAEGGPMPPQPRSLVFPGELAPALMKLYGASNGAGAKIEELVEGDVDETAVRGMLLRLMAEELLIASSQS